MQYGIEKMMYLWLIIVAVIMAVGGLPACAQQPEAFRAIERFNQGDYTGAAHSFAIEVSQRPRDIGTRLGFAISLLQLKEYEKATNQLQEAIRLAPDAQIIHQLLQTTYSQARSAGRPIASDPIRIGSPRTVTAAQPGRGISEADDSLKMLEDAVRAHPRSAPLANLLGDAYHLAGNTAKAEEFYLKAISLAPRWTKPVLGLAIVYLESDAPRAATLLEDVLRRDSKNSRAKLWLGDAYLRLGRDSDAVVLFRQAEQDPSVRADARVRLGNFYFRNQQAPQALQQFSSAVEVDPDNVGALAGMAQSKIMMNRYEEGEVALEKTQQVVQSASPQMQARVLNVVGGANIMVENYQPAEQSLKQAFILDPNLQQPYVDLARLHLRQGEIEAEIKLREESLANNPDDIVSLRYLAEAYPLVNSRERQVNILKNLSQRNGGNDWLWQMRMAEAYWVMDQKDRAVDVWINAVDLGYPTRTAQIAQSIISLPGAVSHITKRLKQSPDNLKWLHLAYAIASQQGQLDEALSLLDEVIKRDPGNPSLYGQKGQLLRQLNRDSEAEESLRKQLDMTLTPGPRNTKE